MNRAFTHADGALDVTVAYYAASQMIAFTAERFGWDGITKALQLWGEGKRNAEVVRGAFGVSATDYDAQYRAWQMARLARYKGQYQFDRKPVPLDDAKAAAAAQPRSASAHVDLGFALAHMHQIDDAKKELDAALALDPSDLDAHFIASKIAEASKDPDGQEKHLRAIKAAGGDGYTVEALLGQLAADRKDKAATRAYLEAAHRFDPTQAESLKPLVEMALADKRDADALRLLRELAMVDQHDRGAWALLLSKLVEGKQWDEARRIGEAAIYVDVENAGIHVHYAQALSAGGDHDAASYELESALLCDAKPQEKAAAHVLLAKERLALGDAAGARSHKDEALKLDPTNADAQGLKL
jgi:tetratricopeptide (TPR) repeat protein